MQNCETEKMLMSTTLRRPRCSWIGAVLSKHKNARAQSSCYDALALQHGDAILKPASHGLWDFYRPTGSRPKTQKHPA